MKAYLTRRYMFSASHRLHNDALSAAREPNRLRQVQQSSRPRPQLYVEVTVSGQVVADTGMVCNLADLDGFVNNQIIGPFDLQNLNTLPEFASTIPTTENLCVVIFDILQRGFTHAHLEKMRIEETMMNSFEYAGGGEIRH